jgi:hypothetical protein
MHLAGLFALVGSLAFCAASAGPLGATLSPRVAAADPIARLVDRLSASHGLWQNGLFPSLGLTASASNEEILSRIFELYVCAEGRVFEHGIVEVRQIRIPGELPDLYTALLVETNLGRKIVILKFNGPVVDWWSRVYDPDAA